MITPAYLKRLAALLEKDMSDAADEIERLNRIIIGSNIKTQVDQPSLVKLDQQGLADEARKKEEAMGFYKLRMQAEYDRPQREQELVNRIKNEPGQIVAMPDPGPDIREVVVAATIMLLHKGSNPVMTWHGAVTQAKAVLQAWET